jgi:hypothetical protein
MQPQNVSYETVRELRFLAVDEVRKQLARLCRRKETRWVGRNMPCRWAPTAVMNCRTTLPYSDGEAFLEIADALENPSIEVKLIVLRVPAGKTGYALLIPQPAGTPPIYAKVQFGAGSVVARSFHYSTSPQEDES